MQILVVVANIQWRTLKAEVEKVSVSTAVGHGSVGPKARCNCSPQSRHGCLRVSVRVCRKGMREHSATRMQRTEVVTRDDPVDHVHWPRMTQSSLFEGRVEP